MERIWGASVCLAGHCLNVVVLATKTVQEDTVILYSYVIVGLFGVILVGVTICVHASDN